MNRNTRTLIACIMICTACSKPVSDDQIINREASLPLSFGLDRMIVIASSVNKKHHTMSTLYGNQISAVRTRAGGQILSGEKMLLVTWRQKTDKNWFGANIPDRLLLIEEITTGADPALINFKVYRGDKLEASTDLASRTERVSAILHMQASIMP